MWIKKSASGRGEGRLFSSTVSECTLKAEMSYSSPLFCYPLAMAVTDPATSPVPARQEAPEQTTAPATDLVAVGGKQAAFQHAEVIRRHAAHTAQPIVDHPLSVPRRVMYSKSSPRRDRKPAYRCFCNALSDTPESYRLASRDCA